MNNILEYNGKKYPQMQSQGFAAQFAIPYAKHYCKGVGYDIGCCKPEWSYPGSITIDPAIDTSHDAYNLPDQKVDYIFSSHCLEHLSNWVSALNYWIDHIKSSGYLFLYLPHYDQEYWRPWNNRKHIHAFTPCIINDFLKSHSNIVTDSVFVSEKDLNCAFMAVAEIL